MPKEVTEYMDEASSLTFEFDNKGSYYAFLDRIRDSSVEAFTCKVLEVFNDIDSIVVEYWPHLGQIIAWEGGYQNLKRPLSVSVTVQSWIFGWNEIADDKEHSSEHFEKLIEEYERAIFNAFVAPIVLFLKNYFVVKAFITDEVETST